MLISQPELQKIWTASNLAPVQARKPFRQPSVATQVDILQQNQRAMSALPIVQKQMFLLPLQVNL